MSVRAIPITLVHNMNLNINVCTYITSVYYTVCIYIYFNLDVPHALCPISVKLLLVLWEIKSVEGAQPWENVKLRACDLSGMLWISQTGLKTCQRFIKPTILINKHEQLYQNRQADVVLLIKVYLMEGESVRVRFVMFFLLNR